VSSQPTGGPQVFIRHYQDLIDVNWDATKLSKERSLSGDLVRGFRKSNIGAVFFGKK
jgi:hypothetical protein